MRNVVLLGVVVLGVLAYRDHAQKLAAAMPVNPQFVALSKTGSPDATVTGYAPFVRPAYLDNSWYGANTK